MSDSKWPFSDQALRGERPIDVLCLGHALVDRLAHASPDEVDAAQLVLGAMTLVDAARAAEIETATSEWSQVAGGSAANTAAGIASLGGRPAFAGAVGHDEIGRWYSSDLGSNGVECHVATVNSGSPTGVCHVFVTARGERSMATSLGAACEITAAAAEKAGVARAKVIYVEGYLLDALAKEALDRAVALARESGTLVALSLSDPFVVSRHHDRIAELVFGAGDQDGPAGGTSTGGVVDILLGNEEEVLELTREGSLSGAAARLRRDGRVAVVTMGANGSMAVLPDGDLSVAADDVGSVVDTTGAGDLFAAGFLYALTNGEGAEGALRLGNFSAGEVIGHLGARPAVKLAGAVPAGLLSR